MFTYQLTITFFPYIAPITVDYLYGSASIGGLLGLGFGFSVISAIELVYFFGIRWIFNNKREAAIAAASSTVVSTAPKSNTNGKPSAIFTQPEQATANKLSYNHNNYGQFI